MVRLDPMNAQEFSAFLERAIPRRAARYARRGMLSESGAVEASRAAYARVLPQGLGTPHHHFCHIRDELGATLGEVWYRCEEEGGVVQFRIEWIWVEPGYRGRGVGSEALRLLETEARAVGAPRTILEVWMDNPDAVRLYRRRGYTPLLMAMAKPTGPK